MVLPSIIYDQSSKIKHEKGTLQTIHTPFSLCEDMLCRLNQYCDLQKVDNIAVLFNLEFVDVLIRKYKIDCERITFFPDSELEKVLADSWYEVNLGQRIRFSRGEINMGKIANKFHVVVMNPPYQAPKDSAEGGNSTLWDKFVSESFNLTADDGYVCAVHPANWRSQGEYSAIGDLLRSKQMEYLEIHDVKDGEKLFGASTRYDWYVVKNANNTRRTKVRGQDGKITDIRLQNLPVIPNGKFEEVIALFAQDDNEKIDLRYERSTYGTDKDWMSKKESKKHHLPCVCHVNINNEISSMYYSEKDNGHFGTPKVIFARMAGGVFVDMEGKYGCCQDVSYIVDKPENLPKIATALRSKEFIDICKMMSINLKDRYDRTAMKNLRKDFWKDFV